MENSEEPRKSYHERSKNRSLSHGRSRPPLTDNQLRTSISSDKMAGTRPATAKKTKRSRTKAQQDMEKKQQKKRQKLDQEALESRKPRGKYRFSDSESEEEPKVPAKAPKGISPATLKLQQQELEIAKLKKENSELKARKSDVSPKNSDDEDSDFSDKARISDDLDDEEEWSGQQIKRHVRKFGVVPLKADMKASVLKQTEKVLFRYVKFIPMESAIKPACEKLLEKCDDFKDYFKVKELDPRAYKKLVKQFVEDYGDVVCRAINKARTTAQSEMKKAYIKAYKNKIFGNRVEDMPSVKEIQNVIQRKGLIDPKLLELDNIDPGFKPYIRPKNIQDELDHAQETIAKYTVTDEDSDDETVEPGQESTKQRKRSSRKAKKTPKEPRELDEEEQQDLARAQKMWDCYQKNDANAREIHEAARKTAWKEHCEAQFERSMAVFIWYWLCLLPCICKHHQWGQNKRETGLPSFHAPLNNSKDIHVTATDEALVGIIYENCAKRFPFLAKLTVPYDQEKHGKDPEYQAKWSSSTKGQNKFGGWDEKAVLRFVQIKGIVAYNRKHESGHLKEVETDALHRIQAKKGNYDVGQDESDGDEPKEKVELPAGFAALAYDSDVDADMEKIDLSDPVEVYLPVPKTKEEKKREAKASKSG